MKICTRQHRQTEQFKIVRIERHRKIYAIAETGKRIAGKSVNKIKTEYDTGIVQISHVAYEQLLIKRTVHFCKHIFMRALQTDLERTRNRSKRLGKLPVYEFRAPLKVVKSTGRFLSY